MKKVFLSLLVVFIFLLFPQIALAAAEFSTSYDAAYDVNSDGVTQVTEKITLKNLTSRYFASNFTLTIGSTTISDVSASDGAGTMETDVKNEAGKTSITVKFNQQVAGIDKSQTFTLKFKSKDFAQSLGKTWEVNLPRIADSEEVGEYNLVLSTPISFGDPTSISPKPKKESQTYDKQFFTFDKTQLLTGGVSINFGTNQIFDFNLKYHLDNNSLFPVITSVTLPPDTAYQDILISRITPQPENVTIDSDGNYLAWYTLQRRSQKEVAVSGSAKLYIYPKTNNKSLTSEEIKDFTKNDKYWEKNNPTILTTLSQIFKEGTPKTNHDKARLIYNFVVKHLKYDTNRLNDSNIERLGAVTALNNPTSSVCMEFTDLFIALSRAAEIPTRELDGFAYSQNQNLRPLSLSKNLLHAWPEYFDESKGWVMVDPTWENSSGGVDYFNKFDLNHLVFAIKGSSSLEPYVSDDVKVSISETDFLGKPLLEIDLKSEDNFWAGLPGTLIVRITNSGNSLALPKILSLDSKDLKILEENKINLTPIPPFGSLTYKFNLRAPFIWQEITDNLQVIVDDQKINKNISIKPFYAFIPVPYLLAGILGIVLLGYGTILAFHILKKQPKMPKPID